MEVNVIDADGIEIIRKWKESINADADSTSEDTTSSTEPLKATNNDLPASNNKLLEIALSSLQQTISSLQHTNSSLQQQINVKDQQIEKLSEELFEIEALRLQSDRNDAHFETQQKMTIALMAKPKVKKFDTAYFFFFS